MRVTVIIEGSCRPGYAVWAQALDQSTQEKVPFGDNQRDVCIAREDDAGASHEFDVPDGADLVVYEEKEADAAAQDAYMRTGQ